MNFKIFLLLLTSVSPFFRLLTAIKPFYDHFCSVQFPALSLTRSQMSLCHQYPDVTAVALYGQKLALNECLRQFHRERWNCSTLKEKNKFFFKFFVSGYREMAFASAIWSAGVTHAVTRFCSQSGSFSCGCSPYYSNLEARKTWRWGGCRQPVEFALKFENLFFSSREKSRDFQAIFHDHNRQVGRMVVSKSSRLKCKCHGVSGSCELRTCWKTPTEFRTVGKLLKKRFGKARLVAFANAGETALIRPLRLRKRQVQKRELVYYEKSPNYCEPEPAIGWPGTYGRVCNKSSSNSDGCQSMCCGRGYDKVRQRRSKRCNCRFKWCCDVKCDTCSWMEWVTTCK